MFMYKHVFQLENQKLKITENLIYFVYIYVSNRSIVLAMKNKFEFSQEMIK